MSKKIHIAGIGVGGTGTCIYWNDGIRGVGDENLLGFYSRQVGHLN